MTRNGVLVVGSANMDMVVMTKRFPQAGETVFGGRFGMFPGGKGANQAVCCAKLGVRTFFIGKMGKDVFRDKLSESMKQDGVRLKHLLTDPETSTGIGLITVDSSGQNEIVVVSGSNMKLQPADLEHARSIFSDVRVVLLQLEIPLPTVRRAVSMAKDRAAIVILNPAPARKLPAALLRSIDYLTPNETETELLTGMPVRSLSSGERAAHKLLDAGVKNVILTMGVKGALLVNRETTKLFPTIKTKAIDTTAAGDAFNGALACALAQGSSLYEAIPFANRVAAFSVTRVGAQSSMPTMKDLEAFAD